MLLSAPMKEFLETMRSLESDPDQEVIAAHFEKYLDARDEKLRTEFRAILDIHTAV